MKLKITINKNLLGLVMALFCVGISMNAYAFNMIRASFGAHNHIPCPPQCNTENIEIEIVGVMVPGDAQTGITFQVVHMGGMNAPVLMDIHVPANQVNALLPGQPPAGSIFKFIVEFHCDNVCHIECRGRDQGQWARQHTWQPNIGGPGAAVGINMTPGNFGSSGKKCAELGIQPLNLGVNPPQPGWIVTGGFNKICCGMDGPADKAHCTDKIDRVPICYIPDFDTLNATTICASEEKAKYLLQDSAYNLGPCPVASIVKDVNNDNRDDKGEKENFGGKKWEGHQAGNDESRFRVYPNPFSRQTTIFYTPATEEEITLQLINITGERVRLLFQGSVEANQAYQIPLDREGMPAGIYFVELIRDRDQVEHMKLILTR